MVTPKSGMPVTAPALSAQVVMSSKFVRSSTPVPMRAKLSSQAFLKAARAASPLSLESTCLTTILRPATHVFFGLQLLLMYFAQPSTPLWLPWKRPGNPGTSIAATTVTVIVVGVTPISVDLVRPSPLCASGD